MKPAPARPNLYFDLAVCFFFAFSAWFCGTMISFVHYQPMIYELVLGVGVSGVMFIGSVWGTRRHMVHG